MKASTSTKSIKVSSFDVNIEIEYDPDEFFEEEILERLNLICPGIFTSGNDDVEHHFALTKHDRNGYGMFELHHGGEPAAAAREKDILFEMFDSRIRITVAEFAKGKVFVHAGAVGWKNTAIVFPGKSFHGKTTLVAELVRRGASYFSDEYAVFDEAGMLHPFPKMLSMRGIIDDFTQVDLPVETFGGSAAEKPCEVGLVLLTEFDKDAVWKPEIVSRGEGLLEIISHTLPIRYKPEFTLKVLNKISNRAIIYRTRRGEANIFADLILDFAENQVIN